MSENISGETRKSIFTSPYFVLVVLMLGVFMMMLDAYIFSPALVTIVKDFNTSFDMVAWVATLYMLVSTAVMPLAGKLSDIFGRKRIFIAGVFFFTVGLAPEQPVVGHLLADRLPRRSGHRRRHHHAGSAGGDEQCCAAR